MLTQTNYQIQLINQQKLTPLDKFKNGETKSWLGSLVSWGWSKIVEAEAKLPPGPYVCEALVRVGIPRH